MLVFAVTKLLTGIFVQRANEASEHDKAKLLESSVRSIFMSIDEDRSGYVTKDEFVSHMLDPQVGAYFSLLQISPHDVSKIFTMLDQHHDNKIDIDEFIKGCQRFKGSAKCIDMALLCSQVDGITSQLDLLMGYVETTVSNLMEPCKVQETQHSTAARLNSANMVQGNLQRRQNTQNSKRGVEMAQT